MIGYATITATKRNLATLRKAGWRLLLSPYAHDAMPRVLERAAADFRYAIDNGAFSTFVQGAPFDENAFLSIFPRFAKSPRCDWVVVPDIPEGGATSLQFSAEWLKRIRGREFSYRGALLLAVQDGMEKKQVERILRTDSRLGIFVGGSSDFKFNFLPVARSIASELGGRYLHVGRVNTAHRIRYCARYGADSFDGTSVTRYSVTMSKLDSARREQTLFDAL